MIVITIDGPVASGKSTVALALANRLSFYYLYSGLLYRFIAYYFMHVKHVNEHQLQNITFNMVDALFSDPAFEYRYTALYGAEIIYKGENFTKYLKGAAVDRIASIISVKQEVREALMGFQRKLGAQHNLIADGRDCGSVVFPAACYKFFLTASEEVRARRWQKDQMRLSNIFTLEESIRIIADRDARDTTRAISPLKKAEGAIEIDSSTLTLGETIDKILGCITLPRV